MSLPDFDKILKAKLGEISPEYKPAVWERIRKRLPPPFYTSVLAGALPWLIGGISTAALVAVLFEVNALKKETHFLHQSLDASTQTLSKTTELIADLRNRPSKVDTVYIANQPIASPLLPALGSVQAYRDGYRAALKDRKYFPTYPQNPDADLSYSPGTNQTGQNENPGLGPKENRTGRVDQAQPLLPNRPSIPTKANDTLTVIPGDFQVNTQKKELVIPIDSVKKEPVSIPKPTNQTAPFRLANLKPRLGIETAYNLQNSIGIGPLLEFQLNQNLSLAFGILATQGQNLYFDDEYAFEERMKTSYKSIYGNEVGNDPGVMKEIEIFTSYVELPVRIKYYVPIKGKFSLVPFAGTHFDLSATERVKCERYFGSTDEHYSFTKRQKTTFFHTYTFGLGAQWKNEKTIWQLTPYYTYNFRQSTLYENANQFGISLSLWFPFYRP